CDAAPAAEAASWAGQVEALGAVARDAQLRSFADNPRVTPQQVFDVVSAAAKTSLAGGVSNLLRLVIENGRLEAVPEVATQFRALLNARE
ncbi:F0F1 ATP synthase subunit delta, partial [Acinetobacter baumannii]|nr:F0F1 ATP synthase subunit delta [Acinetobacter baumannii]